MRVVEHVLEGGKPRTDDTRTPNGVRIAPRNRLVEHGVEAKGGNQRDVLVGAAQSQFADAVGLISEELHGHSWQPAPQQADHLACPHAQGFVPKPEIRADLRGGGQHAQKG